MQQVVCADNLRLLFLQFEGTDVFFAKFTKKVCKNEKFTKPFKLAPLQKHKKMLYYLSTNRSEI